MEKSFKLLPPLMPNFLAYETPQRPRQEGFKPNENRIPVGELTESEAIEYGELMKQTFIEHWKNKKLTPPSPPNDRIYKNTWSTSPPPSALEV